MKTTPGDEGKWFAAAKDAGLYDDALALASRTPCDPKTLSRAARDYAEKEPAFAVGAGMLALNWLVLGYGYEITSVDVWDAYRYTVAAAEQHGSSAEIPRSGSRAGRLRSNEGSLRHQGARAGARALTSS